MLLTFLRTLRIICRLSAALSGRLIRATLLAIITADLKFNWARNTPTRLVEAPRVLLRTTKVLPSAWLCTQVRGVTLTALSATKCGTELGLSTLRRVLHSGCRHGLTPLESAFGKNFRCLLVLIVGWASMTCAICPLRSVRIVPVMVRQAPFAFVGLTLKATAPVLTVLMQCPRPSDPVWTACFCASRTPAESILVGWALSCSSETSCLIVLGASVRLACSIVSTLVINILTSLMLLVFLEMWTLPLCIRTLVLGNRVLTIPINLLVMLRSAITGRDVGMTTAVRDRVSDDTVADGSD